LRVSGADPRDFLLDARFFLTFQADAAPDSRAVSRQWAGRLTWRHETLREQWQIADPFGQTQARLSRFSDGSFLLEQAGKPDARYAGVAELEAALELPIPFAALPDWLLARSDVGVLEARDAQGRVTRLQSRGWRIDYFYDDMEGAVLPRRVEAALENTLRLKLVIERQIFDQKENDAPPDNPRGAP
jgi:outer membrane biogenesis lipoprotein LolB